MTEWMLNVGDVELCMSYLHYVAHGGGGRTEGVRQTAGRAIVNLRAAIAYYLWDKAPSSEAQTAFNEWRMKISKSVDSIVMMTTNYDLVIERLLGPDGYFYPKVQRTPLNSPPPMRLYKLHGSVNWLERRWFDGKDPVPRKTKDRRPHVADTCKLGRVRKCGSSYLVRVPDMPYRTSSKTSVTYIPIVVPFFFQKDEWVGRQSGWKCFPPHWEDARQYLADRTRRELSSVFFFGYSLPAADYHLMGWLLQLFRENRPREVTHVFCGDGQRLMKALGSACDRWLPRGDGLGKYLGMR